MDPWMGCFEAKNDGSNNGWGIDDMDIFYLTKVQIGKMRTWKTFV